MADKISTLNEWKALDYDFVAHIIFSRIKETKDTPEGKMTGTRLRRIHRAIEIHNDVVAVGPLREHLDNKCLEYDLKYGE